MWSRTGLLACLAFLVGTTAFGESYPFSKFSMYANVGARSQGAVPVFLGDGRLTHPEGYTRFRGLDPSWRAQQQAMPGSLGYVTNDGYRWISQHAAAPGEPPGPVRFAIGYVVVKLTPDGQLTREAHVLTEGTAWPR